MTFRPKIHRCIIAGDYILSGAGKKIVQVAGVATKRQGADTEGAAPLFPPAKKRMKSPGEERDKNTALSLLHGAGASCISAKTVKIIYDILIGDELNMRVLICPAFSDILVDSPVIFVANPVIHIGVKIVVS